MQSIKTYVFYVCRFGAACVTFVIIIDLFSKCSFKIRSLKKTEQETL